MPGMPSTFISPDVLKDAQAASRSELTVPDGADVVGVAGEKGYRASWSETLDITKVSTAPSKKGNGWIVTTVQFTIAPDEESVNAGQPAWQRFSTFPPAQGQKQHEYYGLHSKAIARMANLLRATNMIAEGEGYNPKDYFDVDDSPLLGQRVVATVTHFVKKDGTQEQEIGHFTSA